MAQRRPYRTLDGSMVWELVRPEDGARNVSLARALRDADQRTAAHLHRTSEEIYYVLSGEGVVVVGGQRHQVRPGDAVIIPPGMEHFAVAVGGPLEILCVCAPPYQHEDTELLEAVV